MGNQSTKTRLNHQILGAHGKHHPRYRGIPYVYRPHYSYRIISTVDYPYLCIYIIKHKINQYNMI